MTLSNTLFLIISHKLKLKVSLLDEEKLYLQNIRIQADSLKKVKENGFISPGVQKDQILLDDNQDLVLMYIISISFLRANTTIHVSDMKSRIKLFYSAGSVGLSGKQKRQRRVAIAKLISFLLKKAIFLTNKPIALHLNSVNSYKSFIVSKLKRSLYIRTIKSFNQTPYNGCRKKKARRKKYTKKFK